MDCVLVGLQREMCLVYLNNIIVLGQDGTQILEHLGQVFASSCGSNPAAKSELPLVGVVDTSDDDSYDCALFHPSIHRMNKLPHTNLFCD